MFRRLPHTLPPDPSFPPDLETLGFFINEDDQIRMIKNPTQKYQYQINRNDRVNQVYKEANNAAVRKIIRHRLFELALETVRIPLGASEGENHVPILVSKDIGTKDRVIVFFGERAYEPGLLSWRVIGEEGIKVGSLLDFVGAALFGPTPTSQHAGPGIVIANPCQLLWYRGGARAVSSNEWLNLPRESAVHEAFRVDEVKNKIPGNRNYEEHVHYIFDHVLPILVKQEARLDIIGLEFPGSAVVEYLSAHWDPWSSRITGISLIAPQHKIQDLIDDGAPIEFVEFISKRCRAYFVSPSRLEKPIEGRERLGCNCYSSGETMYQDSAMVRCWGSVLDWFNMLHANPEYQEVEFLSIEDGKAGEEANLGW
ncbi:uncharacterized protein Z518_04150 [Rhinocladiella mackenziei CBS 650.93]|uniref:Arb2 domain-containing protein n=1 Tax=Rhinocladiella mackenziei CBS 650.93 TaxID=1442369 RepID=A0A0D2ISN5_9EURO|nr:uncharacterized protein Z518_04150 [Rhinocladiella mackenziei CBS 650.93]KIX06176.1 hypothetical protein Z518_04150 [Rhinocladiella mackenziei CBS 650.93]